MELNILDSFLMELEVEKENKFGQIFLSIKDTGKTIKLMVEEDWYTLMEMYIKEIGKMIKLMEKEYIDIKMGRHMLDNGLRIYNMVMEYKNKVMVLLIKGRNIVI